VEHKINKIFKNKIESLKQYNFLVAVSGGVDSMVLANLFIQNNLNFSIAHCNFDLRAEESNADEEFILSWSKNNNIKSYSSKFSTKAFCEKSKVGIQEGARNLRYNWFNELKVIHKFDYIVTAHHLDDQLETYLINSMRGTGLNGLLGIPEITSNLFRPLLQILKDEILMYADINKIDFREDSSNSKNDYYRNMIRNSIIPEFKKFDDNVMLKFKTTVNNLISTKIFVETTIKQKKIKFFEIDNDKIKVKIGDLLNLEPLEFYMHHLFIDYDFNFKEIIKIFKSDSGKFIISKTHRLTKNKNLLIITRND
jgi:tRNA(Ile)-lysidine synthase